MEMDALPPLQNIQSLYLNAHGADVWFRIYDELVPGHKIILGAMCPYYRTMFYGLLPENNVVNMTEAVGSVESFKEFLKFMYLLQPNLTMDNIEDVISLVKQSLSVEYLSACEMVLKKYITDDPDTIFRVYRWAILYDLEDLKMICSDYVCVYADQVLKSSTLPEFPLEYLRTVLQCDALACEEIDVFNALMTWAKTACKEKNLDPSSVTYLRDELRDVIYQIRFTSMTKSDASRCIRSYPGLFTANELEEIICMVAKEDKFQPKQFNWTPRYFDLNWNKGRFVQFSLLDKFDGKESLESQFETTRFTCNRWVILKSFSYQLNYKSQSIVRVIITESRGEKKITRFDETLVPSFKQNYSVMVEMDIVLKKPIVLRPNYCYEIDMEFEFGWVPNSSNHSQYKTKKRVDHDIVFNFEKNNIVSGLSIYRFDNKNYFQKVFHNPKTWIALFCVGIAGAAYFVPPVSVAESQTRWITPNYGVISRTSVIVKIRFGKQEFCN